MTVKVTDEMIDKKLEKFNKKYLDRRVKKNNEQNKMFRRLVKTSSAAGQLLKRNAADETTE